GSTQRGNTARMRTTREVEQEEEEEEEQEQGVEVEQEQEQGVEVVAAGLIRWRRLEPGPSSVSQSVGCRDVTGGAQIDAMNGRFITRIPPHRTKQPHSNKVYCIN